MKIKHYLSYGIAFFSTLTMAWADPQLTSWFTTYSGQYARLYTNTAMEDAGTYVYTWSNSSFTQSLPAYSGVQEVDYSADWVYLRSTGLGFHIMGPWYLDSAKTDPFPNLPVNTQTFTRIPRTNTLTFPSSKTVTGLGAIGIFVDGVAMYNSWDAYYWNGTEDTSGGDSTGYYWRRDAYVNEGVTFDPSNAHQDQSGTYHYHANPPALRYLLGDSVSYTAATDTYTENPTNLHHSPILAWVNDGLPLYGPYGYSNPLDTNSGIRRMVSGYVLRNGQDGSDNLTVVGRTTIPAWAVRVFGNVSSNQSGPNVSSSYPLGRYMEDNDYLGDLGYTQGVDFDLDEYNCRYCVTPEFPGGAYAYFVSISSNGTPVYPYNIGAGYYGNPTGGTVSSLTETVTTNYLGGPNASLALSAPVKSNNTVTLVWTATQGGTYQIQASTNLTTWTNKAVNITAQGSTAQTSFSGNGQAEFYKAVRTNLASYDPVSSSASGSGITSVSPTSYGLGTNFVLTIYLNANASPQPPPQNAPVNSVTIGSISGTSLTHVSQTEVQATFNLSGATGAQTVTVVFPGPPDDPSDVVTYTLVNGFTVQ